MRIRIQTTLQNITNNPLARPLLALVPSWVAQQGIEDSDISVQYTWSVFASLSQMLCIGYGAHEPRLPSGDYDS